MADRKYIPVIGERYGARTIIEDIAEPNELGQRVVRTRCDCGREAIVQFHHLRYGTAHYCKTCSPPVAKARERGITIKAEREAKAQADAQAKAERDQIIRTRLAAGEKGFKIARDLGIDAATVSRVKRS